MNISRSKLGSDNAAVNRQLADELRRRVALAALGGPEAVRARHKARGKLLPRERVDRLLDPASPFLEIGQLAAHGLYERMKRPAPASSPASAASRAAKS